MKLLSHNEGKSHTDVETAAQKLRVVELDAEIVRKRKELNDLEQSFLQSLSETGQRNYEEEELWKEKIASFNEEVTNLEERKKRALVPLEEREKQIQTKESVLLKREEQVTIKESDLEYTKQLLEDKLDVISEREQDTETYAQTLNNREFAISIQEQQVKDRMQALTEILRETAEDILISQADIARQKAVVKGRSLSVAEREKFVEQQEASFRNREKSILDKYRMLQRTITEVNLNKNGDHSMERNPL